MHGAVASTSVSTNNQDRGRPNLVLIITDDQEFRSLEQMPNVRRLLEREGTSFANFVVSTPGCSPSRATILRGQHTDNHGALFSNPPPGGSSPGQRRRDADGDGPGAATERRLGTDPANPDMDSDGLTDGEEIEIGTDPFDIDTDGDGVIDDEEIEILRNRSARPVRRPL